MLHPTAHPLASRLFRPKRGEEREGRRGRGESKEEGEEAGITRCLKSDHRPMLLVFSLSHDFRLTNTYAYLLTHSLTYSLTLTRPVPLAKLSHDTLGCPSGHPFPVASSLSVGQTYLLTHSLTHSFTQSLILVLPWCHDIPPLLHISYLYLGSGGGLFCLRPLVRLFPGSLMNGVRCGRGRCV